MGNRYREEKPFAFFDPEQDWENQRPAPPRHRSAPVSPRTPISSRAPISPRGPISPRAQPPGNYPPEPDYGYNNRLGMPGSPRERPFGHYDPEVDERERPRQGMGSPARPLDADPEYYGASQPRPNEPEINSRGIGRGAPSPHYVKSDSSDHLSMLRGGPPNSSYARGATEPGFSGSVSGPGRGGGSYGDPASGRKPTYGDGDSGFAIGRGMGGGRGEGVPPMGDGRYVYGGFQLPERRGIEVQEYGTPPAPISSEHAHQVYASVFSDPVYGGARQLNARKGYQEEPASQQKAHLREDVLRHPDQY